MKKLFGLLLALVITLVMTTACNKTTTQAEVEDFSGDVRVGISYKDQHISFADATPYEGLDGVTYVQGELLATWAAYAEAVGVNFVDVGTGTNSNNNYDSFKADSYDGVDIIHGKLSTMQTDGMAGEMLNLMQFVNMADPSASSMPNLSAMLANNTTILGNLQQANGGVYGTPYFDGLNEVEKMILMQTDWVENVLDSAAGEGDDSATSVDYIASLKVAIDAGTSYTAFYDGVDTEIMVPNASGDGVDTFTKTVAAEDNIITKMNTKIADETILNGEDLLDEFKSYLADAFDDGDYDDNTSIFCSNAAGYDADELVALMRVIKANPMLATGRAEEECDEIEILIPREATKGSRSLDVMRFMQIWGIRGVESRSNYFYYDSYGLLQDSRKDPEFMDGISNLNALHTEGLIMNDYTNQPSNINYRTTLTTAGNIFMLYDYNGSSTTNLAIVHEGGIDMTGREACLPPVAAWDDGEVVITENPGVNMFQFTESVRALKADSWGIPAIAAAEADIVGEGIVKTAAAGSKLLALLKVLDLAYSQEGNEILCFGPEEGWREGTFEYNGVEIPAFTEEALDESKEVKTLNSNGTFFEYFRGYVGATMNIGYIRGLGVEYQSLNDSGKAGIAKLNSSIVAGSFKIATTDASYADTPFYVLAMPLSLEGSAATAVSTHTTIQDIFNTSTAIGLSSADYIIFGWDFSGDVASYDSNGDPSTRTVNTVSISEYNAGLVEFNNYFMALYRQAWDAKLDLLAG